MAVWIIAILVVLIVIFYISAYNGLQKAKVNTEEAWSQISVQLKRRNDLIPNLVETVKGYAKHEKETLSKVVELRNQLTQLPADDHEGAMHLSNQITDSLKTIFALSESYPDLKANTNFANLQEELTNTANDGMTRLPCVACVRSTAATISSSVSDIERCRRLPETRTFPHGHRPESHG